MRIQLWSYNYDPEPSGIAPLSSIWTRAMRDRGHEVLVVAAHPHYPKAIWGASVRPYRERRGGVTVLRLPLWIGRETAANRLRQELSYMASLGAVAPLLPTPDAVVAVTPSFPGLLPAMVNARLRGVPWIMWLQDILPEGAATTGLVPPGPMLEAAKWFEMAAYRSAERIVLISAAFERNLRAKGVPPEKMVRIYNPSAVPVGAYRPRQRPDGPPRLLAMGNIGHTQGLAEVVRAVESSEVLDRTGAELHIAGHGVAADEVAATITSDRVKMLGLLLSQAMEDELENTTVGLTVGLVTQRAGVTEFNLPSKLMNYMAHALPVLAVVNPGSETARIVKESDAGWVVDAGRLEDELPRTIEHVLADPSEIVRRGRAAYAAAAHHFAPERIAEQYEEVLSEIVH
jgi:colanic acid biosynthesis glycosyl transferase WcaI